MKRIAVTGGIACGKSTFGECLRAGGVPTCEADQLAHELIEPDGAAYPEVIRAFGAEVVGADGWIDRKRLAGIVFKDPRQLERLNAIVHPRVRVAWQTWADARRAEGRAEAAVIIPLLYEVGDGGGWEAVVCVSASEEVRRARLRARGYADAEIAARVAAQMPVEQKQGLADFVVVNDGSLELLMLQSTRVLEWIRNKRRWV